MVGSNRAFKPLSRRDGSTSRDQIDRGRGTSRRTNLEDERRIIISISLENLDLIKYSTDEEIERNPILLSRCSVEITEKEVTDRCPRALLRLITHIE